MAQHVGGGVEAVEVTVDLKGAPGLLGGGEDRIDVEDSVYLAGLDGPRRTVQVVI